jgi:hypothetical protein
VSLFGLASLTLLTLLVKTSCDVSTLGQSHRLRSSISNPQLLKAIYLFAVIVPQMSGLLMLVTIVFGKNAPIFTDIVIVAFVLADGVGKIISLELARFFDSCGLHVRFGCMPTTNEVRMQVPSLCLMNVSRALLGFALAGAAGTAGGLTLVFAVFQVFAGVSFALIALLVLRATRKPSHQFSANNHLQAVRADAVPFNLE